MKFLPCLTLLSVALLLNGCGEAPLNSPSSAPVFQDSGVPRENLLVVGAGLGSPPAVLEFDLPVPSTAAVVSATFRWVRRGPTSTGDPRILINSRQRLGTLLASYEVGGDAPWVFFYELDARDLLRPGQNRFFVSRFALPSPERADGIGLFVVYDDPNSPWTSILTVDPQEFVNAGSGAVWEFPIGAATGPRNGRFVMFAGDCTGSGSDRVWWSTGSGVPPGDLVGTAPNVMTDRLAAWNGPWMDVLAEDLAIAREATHLVYQLESPVDGTGDSIVHFFGALCTDGEPMTCTGSISGRVWWDDNADGFEDVQEKGLAGVSVSLSDSLGALVATSVTGGTGAFSFVPLCAGDYVVTVDEATLPPASEPTTCNGGDCSPLLVTLPADDGTRSGLAFGWGPPAPTASAVCCRGVGFWKHEYAVLAGEGRGHAHLDAALLEDLLDVVAGVTALDWTRGDGSFDAGDAYATLRGGGWSPCQRAQRHYLACLLNFAFHDAHPGILVDTDHDGVVDTAFGEAVARLEALFAAGGSAECGEAKRVASSINAMTGEGCGS